MSHHHSSCNKECGPFGACILVVDTSPSSSSSPTCHCLEGYGGPDCSSRVQKCHGTALTASTNSNTNVTHSSSSSSLDATVCYNGGQCETYLYDDSVLVGTRCNCHTAVGEAAAAAGSSRDKTTNDLPQPLQLHKQSRPLCEFPTQESCEEGVEHSSYAYCVNGGSCQSIVTSGSPHPFCICHNERFAGRHCQFLASDIPVEEVQYVLTMMTTATKSTTTTTTTTAKGKSSGSRPIDQESNTVPAVLIVVLSTVLVLTGIFFFSSRRWKRRIQMAHINLVTDVTLDEIVFESDDDDGDDDMKDIDMDTARSSHDGAWDRTSSIRQQQQQQRQGESPYRDDVRELESKIV